MTDPGIDVIVPRQRIQVDTLFWQHNSIFAGTQEQLDELRADADARAFARAREEYAAQAERRPRLYEAHRPETRKLTPVVHVGLIPMLWNITTCRCGDRWPCNAVKQRLRDRLGWTVDITDELKAATRKLPKPAGRLTRLLRRLRSRRLSTEQWSAGRR
ncbi:MAG: hypothetical protein ACRD0P_39850 [Stackebrandtia sp.]